MILAEDNVWAGSETSLHAVVQADGHIVSKIAAGAETSAPSNTPRLLSIDNGLATISIKGPLVNSDSPWLEMFGMTGYPEIRDALTAAAMDTNVHQIMLDIDSGGGAVSGVADTAALIRTINDKVKPVTAFTDGAMASAAYWLGSSAGEVYAAKSALVGSIGIISTFREYTKANEKDGVTVTVFRAGKEKALANSNEKLTPKAEAQVQAVLDAAYGVFVDHVAEMRDVSYAVADKKMADGQEFIGKAAVDVGLVDGVSTFDAVVTDLKGKILAYQERLMHNRANGVKPGSGSGKAETSTLGDTDMARKGLTEQDIAALAAGAAQATVALEQIAEGVTAETAGENATENTGAEASNVDTSATQSVVDDKSVVADATVQLLSAQLKDKETALLEAGIKIAKLEEQLAEAHATHTPLLEIAGKSLDNMRVALNGQALSIEGMSAAAVVAEHARMTKQFQSKYPVGGVAAVSSENQTSERPQVDPRHLARVNAARYTTSK